MKATQAVGVRYISLLSKYIRTFIIKMFQNKNVEMQYLLCAFLQHWKTFKMFINVENVCPPTETILKQHHF